MRTISTLMTALVIALSPITALAAQRPVSSDIEAQAMKAMAGAIPAGTRITLQTTAGTRLKGTLLSVSEEAIIVKKNTRLPEPAVTVRFDELARLEREQKSGMSAGKIIGVGLAIGAGAILTMLGIFASIGD